MTEKQAYLEEQISSRLHSWVGRVLLLGIVLFLFIGIADYLITPENARRFLVYRLVISAVLAALYYLNRLRRNAVYQYVIISTAILASAVTVELMILSFGGHRSTYYAGLNLIIITALVLIPFNEVLAVLIAAAIYGIYLVPILIYDTVTDLPVFLANNIFMLSTFCIALTWRLYTRKITLNELSLQFDLAREKEKLEGLVQERTRDLHRSEQWHRSLFENATDGIMVLDRMGRIVNVNEQACRMHGFQCDALLGTDSGLLDAGADRSAVQERNRRLWEGEALVFETEHYRKDGTRFFVEISAKVIPIGDDRFLQLFLRDVTEKKKIQEHLFQSQKMDSIGTLAGGIAHDFNNVLTAILGYTDLIRREQTASERTIERLNIIERAARNAGRMISQLLGFARRSGFEVLSLDLNDVVRDTVKLLERVMDKRIAIVPALDGAALPIKGDVTQLEQVIMNLMVNARDAMPSGGTITLTTGTVYGGEGAPGVPPFIPAGKYVVLRVADTGAGIPEEIRGKIFEPFFTTKERGKGTGLGLAMVYGVVAEHRGYITVDSAAGRGSTFSVYLPAAEMTMPVLTPRPPAPVQGHETILVVDDDEQVLSFVKETLETNGYTVIATTNPMNAIDAFKKAPDRIALVVTDLAMPLIDGGELMRQIRQVRPSTRFLTISGYSGCVADAEELRAAGFLQKPFETSYLLTTVRRVLDAAVSAA